jgi:hypothetical protein
MGGAITQVKFYTKVLSLKQLMLLKALGPFMSENGYYLGGGTALALMFGHRKSVDLDWFTRDPMKDPEIIAARLGRCLAVTNLDLKEIEVARGTLYATANRVRLSMMEYPYPMLGKFVNWQEANCELASLDDLACMKLSAIAKRGAKKDFVDIYALLEKHAGLGEMVSLFRKKFLQHDITHMLYSLTYFDDAEPQPMPTMYWQVSWATMKKQIVSAVTGFAAQNKK